MAAHQATARGGLFGGLFLMYLGLKAMRQPTLANGLADVPQSDMGYLAAYTSTFLLTLSNPVTILSFTAVFAGFGLGSQVSGAGSGLQLVSGVFLGSALWWLTLCAAVTAVRSRLSPTTYRLINVVSGLILTGFGLALLLSLLKN